MSGRYVVVDTDNKTIIGGPYLWDGVSQWTPPEEGTLLLEADATAQGYDYPPMEPPAEPGTEG